MVSTVTTTVEATTITSAPIAEGVGSAATYMGFGARGGEGVRPVFGGRTPECVKAITELGTDVGFGTVGKLLRSPLCHFLDALRGFANAVDEMKNALESRSPC